MKNYALIFPGYGAVRGGMGKTLYEGFDACKKLYDSASEIFGFDAAALSFEGKKAELADPEKSFLLTFTHSMAVNAAAAELLPQAPCAYAGHSAGELTAFTAAGLFSFEDGARAARMYSDMRAEALKAGELECWRLTEVKREFVELVTNKMMEAYVQITAVEGPEQTVIVGEREGIQKTLDELEGKHDAKAAKLPNASALHSMMVFPYIDKMQAQMKTLPVNALSVPVYSNLYGAKMEKVASPSDYFGNQQMVAVQLYKEVKAMVDDGIELFVVSGADKSLAASIKNAASDAAVVVADDIKGLEKLLK